MRDCDQVIRPGQLWLHEWKNEHGFIELLLVVEVNCGHHKDVKFHDGTYIMRAESMLDPNMHTHASWRLIADVSDC